MTSDRGRTHRLFFALRPDAALREELVRTIEQLKTAHRASARWLKPDKLHLTVQFLGDFATADEIVQRASAAAAGLRLMPFEFVLDRAGTFPRRFNPPLVLRCADADALREFARELGAALRVAGLGEYLETRDYVPHVTIAYAQREYPTPVAIAPLHWHASDFCLIDSSGGAHVELARWPLRT